MVLNENAKFGSKLNIFKKKASFTCNLSFQSEYELNLTLTNESDSPITLDIDDDKYAHLYLQSQIKSRKNRKRKIEPNVPLRLTFTAYCPTSNAPAERNVDFIINDKR